MPSDTKVRLYVSKAGSLPGYHVEDDEKTRHRALRACLRKPGADARAVKRRLNVLRIYRKNSRSLRARADALARRKKPSAESRARARALRRRARRNKRACHRITRDMQFLDRRYGLGGTAAICR